MLASLLLLFLESFEGAGVIAGFATLEGLSSAGFVSEGNVENLNGGHTYKVRNRRLFHLHVLVCGGNLCMKNPLQTYVWIQQFLEQSLQSQTRMLAVE